MGRAATAVGVAGTGATRVAVTIAKGEAIGAAIVGVSVMGVAAAARGGPPGLAVGGTVVAVGTAAVARDALPDGDGLIGGVTVSDAVWGLALSGGGAVGVDGAAAICSGVDRAGVVRVGARRAAAGAAQPLNTRAARRTNAIARDAITPRLPTDSLPRTGFPVSGDVPG